MNATINVVCYKWKTLANGEYPLMLRICKDGKKKYQSLGISVLPRYWDFTRNKPKPNCPNKEYIQKIILDKQTELQQRMLEFNSEQKEYTTTTLLNVSIRPTTGIKPLYTTIATVTMNLIVSAAIVLLNPYVTIYISYKIPPFALSVHIPDVSTSIYVEVDSKVLLGLPFCDKAFVR